MADFRFYALALLSFPLASYVQSIYITRLATAVFVFSGGFCSRLVFTDRYALTHYFRVYLVH